MPMPIAKPPPMSTDDDGTIDDSAGDLDAFDRAETIGQPSRDSVTLAARPPPRRVSTGPVSAVRLTPIPLRDPSETLPVMPDPLAETIPAAPAPRITPPDPVASFGATRQHASVPAPIPVAQGSRTPRPMPALDARDAADPPSDALPPIDRDAFRKQYLANIAGGGGAAAVETELVRKSPRKRGLIVAGVLVAAVALGIGGALVFMDRTSDTPAPSAAVTPVSTDVPTTPATGTPSAATPATTPAAPTTPPPDPATSPSEPAKATAEAAPATSEPAPATAGSGSGSADVAKTEPPATKTPEANAAAATSDATTPAAATPDTNARTAPTKTVVKTPVRKKAVAKRPVKRPAAKKKKAAACSGLDCL
jgi:subtilase-type serine protease